MKKKKKKNKRMSSGLLILFFLAGISLLLYPTVSDWWNSLHQSAAVGEYTKIIANMDDGTYERLLKEAVSYNEELFKQGGNRFIISDDEVKKYRETLKISNTGIMGYISIPSIDVKLPIYHGTSEAVLSSGIGHLEGTALPIGGSNTHCVLSGHRGLPSAKLFTNLDKVKEGDYFTLNVLDEVLTYEVDQIRIVLPQEISDLFTIPGKDYCTLITCTPYGVNSHRLLVRGHRITNQSNKKSARVTADAVQIEPTVVAPIAAAPMIMMLLVILFIGTARRKSRRKALAALAKAADKYNKASKDIIGPEKNTGEEKTKKRKQKRTKPKK